MNIYVGNLIHAATEQSVRQLFEGFGAVTAVRIIKDRFTGQSRGFAFVEMASSDEANAAISELNGYEFEGRRLRVSEAQEKDAQGGNGGSRPQGGGFRSNNRFGGGNAGGERRGGSGFGGRRDSRGGDNRGGFDRF